MPYWYNYKITLGTIKIQFYKLKNVIEKILNKYKMKRDVNLDETLSELLGTYK